MKAQPGEQRKCRGCGKQISVKRSRILKNPNRKCMECHKATWKGISKHGGGYVLITTIPGRKGRKELEHRLVMEKILGRKLRPGEVVHHKNHDRKDNRPENLELCASPGVHIRDHHPEHDFGWWRGKKFSKRHRENIRKGMKKFSGGKKK